MTLVLFLFCADASAQHSNLNEIPNQLTVPAVSNETPAAGKRVWQQLDAYREWSVRHAVYLPDDWQASQKYPVIFEYPGNGGFKNALGDISDGTVEGCRMGYGLTQGSGAIWVSLPFVDSQKRTHAVHWWGDAEETVRYCKLVVENICQHWGGDRDRLVLSGFSRGAIATSYIGLRDDEIAKLWCGLISHSHFDGVRAWPYADSHADAATERLRRFQSKPQWISHELSTKQTEQFLHKHGLMHEKIQLIDLPFPNHSADWLLKDLPEAHRAQRWWQELVRH